MRLNFLLIFPLLLVSYSSVGSIGNKNLSRNKGFIWNDFESVKRILDPLMKKQRSSQNETESIGLNADCLYLILEKLDLPGLVNVAQVNAQFYYMTRNVFKRKFSHQIRVGELENTPRSAVNILIKNTETFISRALGNQDPIPNQPAVYSKYDEIDMIRDYQLLLNTLKYFGGVIQKLEMDSDSLKPSVIKTICKYLDKYCASSLIQLELGINIEYWLDALKGPFKNLNEFIFDVGYEKMLGRRKTVSVSEKFPNLKRLALNNCHGVKSSIYLDCYLPQLVYFSIDMSGHTYDAFDKFLKQNPSIRHLEVTGFPNDYIKVINVLLPQLENLTLGRCEFYPFDYIEIDAPIHFENLKVFNLRSYHSDILTKISFSHLHELSVYYKSDKISQWIQFFRMNHTFTRFDFYIHDNKYSNDLEFKISTLIAELPQSVVDISIRSLSGVKTIAEIIEKRKNVMKFQFTGKKLADIEEALRKRFEINFDIRNIKDYYACDGLSFVRKN